MFVSLTREHQFLKNSNKGGPQAGPHTQEELADERKEVGSGDRQGRGEEDVTKKHIMGKSWVPSGLSLGQGWLHSARRWLSSNQGVPAWAGHAGPGRPHLTRVHPRSAAA